MPHNRRNWIQVDIFKDNKPFRRYWINRDAASGYLLNEIDRYTGDIITVVHLPNWEHLIIYHYNTVLGRIKRIVRSDNDIFYYVKVGNHWQSLDSHANFV